jgi:hypothetical protein
MRTPGHPIFGKKPEVRRAEDLVGRPVIKSNLIHATTMKWLSNKLLPFLLNWKTTLAGVALILHGLGAVVDALLRVTDGVPLTLEGLQLATGEIIAGAGLIAARDANKSSQDSKVR